MTSGPVSWSTRWGGGSSFLRTELIECSQCLARPVLPNLSPDVETESPPCAREWAHRCLSWTQPGPEVVRILGEKEECEGVIARIVCATSVSDHRPGMCVAHGILSRKRAREVSRPPSVLHMRPESGWGLPGPQQEPTHLGSKPHPHCWPSALGFLVALAGAQHGQGSGGINSS